jgi:hypothetical protein
MKVTKLERVYWFMANFKHFVAWYKLLRKQYGILTSFSCALYNYRHYDIDGNYK